MCVKSHIMLCCCWLIVIPKLYCFHSLSSVLWSWKYFTAERCVSKSKRHFIFRMNVNYFFLNILRREFFEAKKLVHIYNVIERFVSYFQFLWCLHAKFDMTRSILLVLSAWFECMYVCEYTKYSIPFGSMHAYMCICDWNQRAKQWRSTKYWNKPLLFGLRIFRYFLSIWECSIFLDIIEMLVSLSRHIEHTFVE